MKYTTRQKTKYFGSITLISTVMVIFLFLLVDYYRNAQREFDQNIKLIYQTEIEALKIQSSFKLQVEEWKNILLRGNQTESYNKYFNSFIDQFVFTQEKTDNLLEYLKQQKYKQNDSFLVNKIEAFRALHQSILGDYQDALHIYKNNNFNGAIADRRVRGIDRKPSTMLDELSYELETRMRQNRASLKRDYINTTAALLVSLIFVQTGLCILLIRLAGNLLQGNITDKTSKLGNRQLFIESINDLSLSGKSALICVVDIDDFKIVNSSCGNTQADKYIQLLGSKLKHLLNKGDLLCRIGGDLFGIILFAEKNMAMKTLDELNITIANVEFRFQDICLKLTSSSSSYWIDEKNTSSLETVLNSLYIGLQIAKSKERGQIVHYKTNDADIVNIKAQLSMAHQIATILKEQKAVLFKQAITPVSSASLKKHFEILLRIKNTNNEYLSPHLFLETAERFKLIKQVDKYVVSKALEYIQNSPKDSAHFSINLSGQTLSDKSFIEFIEKMFEKTKIDTRRLNFEITETEIIKNIDNAFEIIACLTKHRCAIYLDDFGTGMSSYAHIAKLDINAIKIDGTFIKGIHESADNQAIVKSITKLAADLNIYTVAEFVESREELETLKLVNIDFAQGYLIHKPSLMYDPS